MSKPLDPTQFTRESAERIARVVRAAELDTPAARSLQFEPLFDARKVKTFRVAAYQGPWPIGTDKVVQFWNDPTGTANVTNLFFPLESPNPAGRFCGVAREKNSWFLIDVPMETRTAAFAGATVTRSIFGTGATSRITFFGTASTALIAVLGTGTAATQTITYSSPGSTQQMNVVTDVSASLNTADCTISVNATKQSISFCSCGSTQTATTISSAGTQTAVSVRMSGTQTAIAVSMSGTQQIQVMTSVFTSTFLKFPD
jgi:hypothetical protein